MSSPPLQTLYECFKVKKPNKKDEGEVAKKGGQVGVG